MIHNNIEFFNVAALEKVDDIPGILLQRFPKEVRQQMGIPGYEKGRIKSQVSTGCEIRFVTDSSAVRVTLTAQETDGQVCVYLGDYFHSIHSLCAGIPKAILVDLPEELRKQRHEIQGRDRFAPALWRFVIGRGEGAMDIFSVALQNVEAFGHEIRPPKKEEVPRLRWLAYGSSITHGSGATVNHNSYIQQAATRLGIDVLNKGIGGSCQCESQVADYIAAEEWDILTLELGVNMIGFFTPGEFETRIRYMLQKIIDAKPDKPIVLITIYPNFGDGKEYITDNQLGRNEAFREVIRKVYQEFRQKAFHKTYYKSSSKGDDDLHSRNAQDQLYLIEGDEILTDFCYLTCDLIHPSDFGHIIMGQNLAEKMKIIIENACTFPVE